MTDDRVITSKEDADSIREDVESVYDGWYAGASRIDWEDFLGRLERRGYDLGDSWTSPAIRRIRAIVAELRAQ